MERFCESVLALTGGLSLLLALDAGLLVMLALTDFLDDACAGALTLEALQGALQGFVLTNTNLGHCNPSFRSSRLDISRIDRRMAKKPYSHYSKNISARQSLILRFFRYFL